MFCIQQKVLLSSNSESAVAAEAAAVGRILRRAHPQHCYSMQAALRALNKLDCESQQCGARLQVLLPRGQPLDLDPVVCRAACRRGERADGGAGSGSALTLVATAARLLPFSEKPMLTSCATVASSGSRGAGACAAAAGALPPLSSAAQINTGRHLQAPLGRTIWAVVPVQRAIAMRRPALASAVRCRRCAHTDAAPTCESCARSLQGAVAKLNRMLLNILPAASSSGAAACSRK